MLTIAKLSSALAVAGSLLLALPGCGESDDVKPVTWHQDIAPLVAEKCNSCHESEGIAPFAFDSYDSAKSYASIMVHQVETDQMPPWLAEDTDADVRLAAMTLLATTTDPATQRRVQELASRDRDRRITALAERIGVVGR